MKPSDRTPACHVPQVQLPRNPRWLPALRTTVSETGWSPRRRVLCRQLPRRHPTARVCSQVSLPAGTHSTIRATFMWDKSIMCLRRRKQTASVGQSAHCRPLVGAGERGGSRALLEGDLIWATAARGHRHQHKHAAGTALPVRARVHPQGQEHAAARDSSCRDRAQIAEESPTPAQSRSPTTCGTSAGRRARGPAP